MMIVIILIIIVIVFIVISRIHTVKANSDGKKRKSYRYFVVILWIGNHKITTRLNRRGSTGGFRGFNPPPPLGGPKKKKKKKKRKKKEKKKEKRTHAGEKPFQVQIL